MVLLRQIPIMSAHSILLLCSCPRCSSCSAYGMDERIRISVFSYLCAVVSACKVVSCVWLIGLGKQLGRLTLLVKAPLRDTPSINIVYVSNCCTMSQASNISL